MDVYVDGSPTKIAIVFAKESEIINLSPMLLYHYPKTLHQAIGEYEAIYHALQKVKPNSSVRILTDFQSAVLHLSKNERGFRKNQRKNHRKQCTYRRRAIRRLIKRKNLKVEFVWTPRKENLAGKLLEHHK